MVPAWITQILRLKFYVSVSVLARYLFNFFSITDMKSLNSDQDFVDDDVFEQHIEDHDVIDYKVTSNFYNIILTLKLKLPEV